MWRSVAIVFGLVACGPATGATGPGGPPATAEPGPHARAAPARPAPRAEPAPGAEAQAMLDLHNKFRAEHCAPPLVWSDELAAVAQRWADTLEARGCAFEHSRTRFGENLAAGTGQHLAPRTVVEMWYREVRHYDFRRAAFDINTGHFTQVVWIGTSRLGCGRRRCATGTDLVVCNYDPPGNVETLFGRNVLAATCHDASR